jgi:hypothetical protein
MTNGRHPAADPDEPEGSPKEAGRLSRYLGRPLLLGFWCLVVWGTLYAGLFAFAALTEGPSQALARALGGPDDLVGVANLTTAAMAIIVWTFVGTIVLRRRQGRNGARGARP